MTERDETVERVAKALWEQYATSMRPWSGAKPYEREKVLAHARAALAAMPESWQPIETAPIPEDQIIEVFGIWCGEINGPDKEPDIYMAHRQGALWYVVGTDSTSAWVEATHWRHRRPAPEGKPYDIRQMGDRACEDCPPVGSKEFRCPVCPRRFA